MRRYVGVAPEEKDEDFDFEESLRAIHIDLNGLNEEAAELSARITPEEKQQVAETVYAHVWQQAVRGDFAQAA
jgi:hypothetical protein